MSCRLRMARPRWQWMRQSKIIINAVNTIFVYIAAHRYSLMAHDGYLLNVKFDIKCAAKHSGLFTFKCIMSNKYRHPVTRTSPLRWLFLLLLHDGTAVCRGKKTHAQRSFECAMWRWKLCYQPSNYSFRIDFYHLRQAAVRRQAITPDIYINIL